ncbi:hypothetical protein CHUAL_010204 [Chamberlinius hualienensis]
MADVQYFLKAKDQHDSSLIEIPKGKIAIGRGPFLQCSEKRVSRNHAELELTDDGRLFITSVHTNPTYYKQNGEINKFHSLEKGQSNELREGDCFSLLSNSCIFEVVIKGPQPSFQTNGKTSIKDTMGENNNLNSSVDPTDIKPVDTVEIGNSENINSVADMCLQDTTSQVVNRKRKLPEWCKEVANFERVNTSETKKTERKKNSKVSEIKDKTSTKTKKNDNFEDDEKVLSSSNCALESSSSSDQTVSNMLKETPQSSEDETVDANSVGISSAKSRPPCQFGGKCYRKNPSHKEEYSHPGDSDFDNNQNTVSDDEDDGKPECEYGTDCYRKNPQHRKEYKHSKKPQRKAVIKAKKRKEKTGDDSDDDEYDESFIDDDSDAYDPKKDDANYSSDDEDT